jgi:TolA-binding protein
MRLVELEDQRRMMADSISNTESRLNIYRDHLVKREEQRKAEIEEQRQRARQMEKDKENAKQPLKSTLKKTKSMTSTKSAAKDRDAKSVASRTSAPGKSTTSAA